MRKYREKNHIEFTPKYFREEVDPNDGITYFVYTNNYFEKHRKE